MRTYVLNIAGVLMLTTILSLAAFAAPGPHPRGQDTIEGQLVLKSGAPVVIVSVRGEDGSWSLVDFWLVFLTPEIEKQAAKLELDSTVKIHGKRMAGGQFRYLIVSTLGK